MNESEYLELVKTAKSLLDQIHLNICLCDRQGKILYVNPHAAESIKALGELVGFSEINTGYDVVGTNMEKWHRFKGFTRAMEERRGQWGTWCIKGVRWRSRSDCVRDDDGNVIGYVGTWEELDQGPSPDDKTEETYLTPPYQGD